MAKNLEPIAIIGMSCRYPQCNDTQEFWQFLREGREGVGPVPQDRLEKGIVSRNYKYETANFLTIPIDKFDASFFGISPKSAKFMDPQLRLLMCVVWEALEDSNVKPENVRGTNTGIFVGAWRREYRNFADLSPEKDFFSVYMGHSMSARLSFFLETIGPALDTDTACSSSMVAVDLACKSLKNETTDMAIVGGVNLLVEPPEPTFLDIGFATCNDGKCKPFDVSANGYGIAEGCGVIVLKRLSDARKNGDRILALIKGSAVTQEGLSRSIGTPTVYSEAQAMSLALKDANVKSEDVSYVEGHGTGTKVGDPIEIKAIEKVYGSTARKYPLVIGTVKANVGHSESCSGITSIIKVVLALQNEMIPKHIHFSELNPDIDLTVIPAILPMRNLKWPRNTKNPRIAGASSYGISGTNVHVIIQEYPFHEIDEGLGSLQINIDKPLSLIVISAKSANALEKYVESYKNFLENSSEKFEDIAHTANVARALFDHRLVIQARDNKEALRNLNEGMYLQRHVIIAEESKPKICMLFPGQGSQYHGMARELYQTSPVFKYHFDECCKILKEMGVDLKSILWRSEGDDDLLASFSQVAIVCVNYCLFKLWESWGIKPDYVLGHSLGESAAVIAIGVRDLRSGLEAIHLKSTLVREHSIGGKMIALKTNQTKAEILTKEFLSNEDEDTWLDVAAINSDEQIVLSGKRSVVERFQKFCDRNDTKSVIIASPHAYHSRKMDPALEGIRDGIAKIHLRMEKRQTTKAESSVKYISSSQGRVVKHEELLNENYWVHNTRHTVRFMEACKVAFDEGCRIFIEIGAHPILSALAKSNCENFGIDNIKATCLFSLKRNENDWEQILNGLAQFALTSRGNEINWNGFEEPYGQRKKVSLPFHPFIRKSYWIDSSELVSYRKRQKEMVHPLLGERIQNATSTQIFQNELSLRNEGLSYLTDHKIGEHIIFPGAGFLELCITASSESSLGGIQKGNIKFLIIQNFKIQIPLKIEHEKTSLLQTILGQKNHGYSIGIFSQNLSASNWTSHCSAESALPDDASNFFQNHPKSIDLKLLQRDFQHWDKNEVNQFYQIELPSVGLNFGHCFQTIQNVWSEVEGNCVLVSLNLEFLIGSENTSNYFMHPLVLDAMIQTTLFLLPRDSLHLPVGIKRFLILKEFKDLENQRYFGYCTMDTGNELFDVYLLNKTGGVLAVMEGLQMCKTTLDKVQMKLDAVRNDELPRHWVEQWKKLPLQSEISSSNAGNSNSWIIFGNSTALSPLSNKMREMGRKLIFFESKHEADELKERIYQVLDEYFESLEGILYFSALGKDETSQQSICEPFLYVCQWIQQNVSTQPLKLIVTTQGTELVTESDLVFNPNPATLWGMAKTLHNECPNIFMKCIDLPSKVSINGSIADKICAELFEDGQWRDDQVALRDTEDGRYAAKLVRLPEIVSRSDDEKPLFKRRCSTYLVTGGMRGLGFRIASWMLDNGARHLILIGRNDPTEEVSEKIKEWNGAGKKVYVFKADVGKFEQCSGLFDWIKDMELPPVRGIIHCAGVLADGILANQTWTNFETVYAPKINGSWNLHKLSLFYKLDFFVMFSSISAQFGLPGQANYSAGNCFADALVRFRHSLDLPGTTINWGNWEEVGMASDLEFPGLKPITVQEGLKSLEFILRKNLRQATVVQFSSLQKFSKLCPRALKYVGVEHEPKQNTSKTPSWNSFWENLSQAKEREAKLQLIEKYVGHAVKRILKMGNDEEIDYYGKFDKLGIDSLMTLELQNELQTLFGKQVVISAAVISDYRSISTLSRKLFDDFAKTDI